MSRFADSPYFLLKDYLKAVVAPPNPEYLSPDISNQVPDTLISDVVWVGGVTNIVTSSPYTDSLAGFPSFNPLTDDAILFDHQLGDFDGVHWNGWYDSSPTAMYHLDEPDGVGVLMRGMEKSIIVEGGQYINLWAKLDSGFVPIRLKPLYEDPVDKQFFRFDEVEIQVLNYDGTSVIYDSDDVGDEPYFDSAYVSIQTQDYTYTNTFANNIILDPGTEIYIRKDSEFHNWLKTDSFANQFYQDEFELDFVIRNYVNTDKLFLYFGKIYNSPKDLPADPDRYHIEFYGLKDWIQRALPPNNRKELFIEFLDYYFDMVYGEGYQQLKDVWSLRDAMECNRTFLSYVPTFYDVPRYDDIPEWFTNIYREYARDLVWLLKRKGTYASMHIIYDLFCNNSSNIFNVMERWHSSEEIVTPASYLDREFFAPVPLAEEYFGDSVSVTPDGQYMVVGESFADNMALNGTGAGHVYKSVDGGVTWTYLFEILHDVAGERLGLVTSISDDGLTILLCGLNVAYIFTSVDGLTWTEQQQLIPSAYSSQYAVRGRLSADGLTAIISTKQGPWAWTSDGATWTEQQRLVPADVGTFDSAGYNVTISSDGLMVAFQAIENGGKVYVWTSDGATWTQQDEFQSNDVQVGDFFGSTLSLTSDNSTLIIGDYANTSYEGAIYVFNRSGSTWTQSQKITQPVPESSARYGETVSVSRDGQYIIAGVWQASDPLPNTGKIVVYKFNGSSYDEYYVIPAPTPSNFFGSSVDVTDGYVILATEIGADTDTLDNVGSVHSFEYQDATSVTNITDIKDHIATGLYGATEEGDGDPATAGAGVFWYQKFDTATYPDGYPSTSGERLSPYYRADIDLSVEPLTSTKIMPQQISENLYQNWEMMRPVHRQAEYNLLYAPYCDLTGVDFSLYDYPNAGQSVTRSLNNITFDADNFIQVFRDGGTVWTVRHTLGTVDVIVSCWDSDFKKMVPDTIQVVDATTVRITNTESTVGLVIVTKASRIGNYDPVTWNIVHGFNRQEVVVQFRTVDSDPNLDGFVEYSTDVEVITNDLVRVDGLSPTGDYEAFIKNGLKDGESIAEDGDILNDTIWTFTGSNTVWNIEHGYPENIFVVNCYDNNNKLIVPADIDVSQLDGNGNPKIVVTFDTAVTDGFAAISHVGDAVAFEGILPRTADGNLSPVEWRLTIETDEEVNTFLREGTTDAERFANYELPVTFWDGISSNKTFVYGTTELYEEDANWAYYTFTVTDEALRQLNIKSYDILGVELVNTNIGRTDKQRIVYSKMSGIYKPEGVNFIGHFRIFKDPNGISGSVLYDELFDQLTDEDSEILYTE